MAGSVFRFDPELSWKSWSAIALFGCGLLGLLSGVEVSARSGVPQADLLTKVYYTLGLFVLGGMDLGTPAYRATPFWRRCTPRGPLWA